MLWSSGATLHQRRTKLPRRDRRELSKDSRFLDLPLELRHYIYADLIYPGVPGSRSALTVTNRQLREEVHDWLAGQKIIIHVRAWQDEWCTAWPWYAPILKRVTNVEFDLSCLPGHPSYPILDLLCLWQHECHLEQVNFTMLDDSVPARKCQYGDDRTNVPDTLPSGSKEILCGWIMHPLKLILAKHKVPHANISMNWKQPSSRRPRKEYLGRQYHNSEAVALVFRSSKERIVLPLHEVAWTPLADAVRSNHRAVAKVLVESAAINIRRAIISGRGLQIEASLAGQPRTLDVLLQELDSQNIAEIQSATRAVCSIDLIYRLLSTFICSLQTYISNVYAATLDHIENSLR